MIVRIASNGSGLPLRPGSIFLYAMPERTRSSLATSVCRLLTLGPEHILKPLYEGGAVMSKATLDRALEALAVAALISWGEFEDGVPHLNVHRLVQDVMRARLAGKGKEAAALAIWATRFSFDEHSGTIAGDIANGCWLPHAQHVLGFAPETGTATGWATWIANFMGDYQLSRGSLPLAIIPHQPPFGWAPQGVCAKPRELGHRTNARSRFVRDVGYLSAGNVLGWRAPTPNPPFGSAATRTAGSTVNCFMLGGVFG